MITSEEVRKSTQLLKLDTGLILGLTMNESLPNKTLWKSIEDFIAQQEKVNELLRLYQKHYKPRTYARPNTIDDYTRIDELESELND